MIFLQVAGLCAQYAQAIGQSGGTGLLAEVMRCFLWRSEPIWSLIGFKPFIEDFC